jgi:uncharacterized Tic20 family protein
MVETSGVSQSQSNAEGVGKPGKDACTWAMLCHIAGLGGFIIPGVGCVVGPLIVWQMKKDLDPFVNHNGKEALNFQITMFICVVIAALLCFVCIGTVLLPVVGIVDLVFLIIAAIKASNGEEYRYPVSIRFVK